MENSHIEETKPELRRCCRKLLTALRLKDRIIDALKRKVQLLENKAAKVGKNHPTKSTKSTSENMPARPKFKIKPVVWQKERKLESRHQGQARTAKVHPAVARFKDQHVRGLHDTGKPTNHVAAFSNSTRVKRLWRAGGRRLLRGRLGDQLYMGQGSLGISRWSIVSTIGHVACDSHYSHDVHYGYVGHDCHEAIKVIIYLMPS